MIARVLPENESGPDTVAVKSEPVPLPTKSPVSVVEPVPPFATVSAEFSVRVPANKLVEDAYVLLIAVVDANVMVALVAVLL